MSCQVKWDGAKKKGLKREIGWGVRADVMSESEERLGSQGTKDERIWSLGMKVGNLGGRDGVGVGVRFRVRRKGGGGGVIGLRGWPRRVPSLFSDSTASGLDRDSHLRGGRGREIRLDQQLCRRG